MFLLAGLFSGRRTGGHRPVSSISDERRVLMITNARAPYAIHNISALSLPNGLTYQFRYDKKYLEIPDGNEASAWIRRLKHEKGVLVLRDSDRGTFIPLREFRVHSTEEFAEHVFFDLEFADYVSYKSPPSSSADAQQQELECYSPVIAGLIPPESNAGADSSLRKLVFTVKASSLDVINARRQEHAQSPLEAWKSLAELLSGMPIFEGLCFHKIIGVQTIDAVRGYRYRLRERMASHNWYPRRWISSSYLSPCTLMGERRGYQINGGKTYLLKLVEIIPAFESTGFVPFDITLDTSAQHLLPMRTAEKVDGPDDRIQFVFYAVPQPATAVTSFLILASKQLQRRMGKNKRPGSVAPMILTWDKHPTETGELARASPEPFEETRIPPVIIPLERVLKVRHWRSANRLVIR